MCTIKGYTKCTKIFISAKAFQNEPAFETKLHSSTITQPSSNNKIKEN